jgi:spore coat polysaccharide biosynthesis protein SpsF (cytidylyltransferase family)
MGKRRILILVDGGVAYVVEDTVPKGIEVEIIDFDNLRDFDTSLPPRLSKQAFKYLQRENKELAAAVKSAQSQT